MAGCDTGNPLDEKWGLECYSSPRPQIDLEAIRTICKEKKTANP